MGWIEVVQDRLQWWTLVNTAVIKVFQEIPRNMELVLWIEFRTDRLGLSYFCSMEMLHIRNIRSQTCDDSVCCEFFPEIYSRVFKRVLCPWKNSIKGSAFI